MDTRWMKRKHGVLIVRYSSAITITTKMSELGDPAVIPSFRLYRRNFLLMYSKNKVLLTLVPFYFT